MAASTVGDTGGVGVVNGRLGSSFPPQAAIVSVVDPLIAQKAFRGIGMRSLCA
jgi:hypothetical protein